jgi:integrase/recombinase XerD
MKWEYWISLYLNKHCSVRGLQPKTITAYRDALAQFREYITVIIKHKSPDQVIAKDILDYVDYLRNDRSNQNAAVNRSITIIKNFYRAIVSMNCLDYRDNPMKDFPKLKAPKRKFRDTLNKKEIRKLINQPRTDTVLGLRDRAILALLYGTGIRATECSKLKEHDVMLDERIIRVIGKGGDERTLPLNDQVSEALADYRKFRGKINPSSSFFRSRKKNNMARNSIYMRVKKYAKSARIKKSVSPHVIRHTFATHLIKQGENLVTVRDLLGHRQLASTQRYLHMTAHDIRKAIDRHPIRNIIDSLKDILPGIKLPFQYPPGERFAFS